jgi:hypothetical protein
MQSSKDRNKQKDKWKWKIYKRHRNKEGRKKLPNPFTQCPVLEAEIDIRKCFTTYVSFLHKKLWPQFSKFAVRL